MSSDHQPPPSPRQLELEELLDLERKLCELDQIAPHLASSFRVTMTWHSDFTKALGTFAMEFLQMEHHLNATIHQLLRLPGKTGHALTSAILNLSTRLEILQILARDSRMSKKLRGVILQAVDEAFELNGRRNWYLHDAWRGTMFVNGETEGNVKRRMRPKGGKRQWQEAKFTPKEIAGDAARCEAVWKSLQPVIYALAHKRRIKYLDDNAL